jgi:SAM-dependent methyltransferase
MGRTCARICWLLALSGCATTPSPAPAPAAPAPPPAPAAHAHGHPLAAVPSAAASTEDDPQPPTADHRFEDPAYWSKVFDDPARDQWQRPAALVAALGIAHDETVVDLGAGTGYMAAHLSKAVPAGHVIAVDVEPELLRYLDARVKKAGLANVETRLAQADDPKLKELVDLVLVVDTYHHIGRRSAYFRRLSQRLSARGRVAIVDFKLGKFPVGPGDDHKLAPEVVTREMSAGGYRLCSSWDGLPYQYVLIFGLACPVQAGS